MRDEVRHCAVCDETTAHQVRGVPWPRLAGAALMASGALVALSEPFTALIVGLPLLIAGAWIVQRDRAQRWDLTCGRCRSRETAALRKPWVWPSEIFIS